jgi:integrase
MESKLILRVINKEENEEKKKYPIYLQYSYKGELLRLNTGFKCKIDEWDEMKKLHTGDTKQDKKDNLVLLGLKNKLDTIVKNCIDEGFSPSLSEVKKRWDNSFEKSDCNNLIEYLQKFITERETDSSVVSNTIKNYKQLKKLLEVFQTYYVGDKKIIFEDVNEEFFKELIHYCIKIRGSQPEQKKKKKGERKVLPYDNNTIRKRVIDFRVFMNWCLNNGYTKNDKFKKFKHKGNDYSGNVFTLTKEEFNEVLNMTFEEKEKKLERVRDLFLLSSTTGLRFSDLIQLKKTNLSENYINVNVIKTRTILNIPINDVSRNILKKYNYSINENLYISNQKYNEYIKEVMKKVKTLQDKVELKKYSGVDTTKTYIEKYNLVSSHTGRKQFINMCLDSNIPIPNIINWTGHKNLKTFRDYMDKKRNEIDNMKKLNDYVK